MNLVRDSLNLWRLSAFVSGQCRVYLAPHRASLTPAVLQPAAAPFAAAAPASCVWQGGTICQTRDTHDIWLNHLPVVSFLRSPPPPMTLWFFVENGGMDPHDSPLRSPIAVLPYSSPKNPFPHSLLRTSQMRPETVGAPSGMLTAGSSFATSYY